MTKMYTLVAYRPDGYDSRCGTHSASELQCHAFQKRGELIEKASALLFENDVAKRKDYARNDWEFTILQDGIDEWSWWTAFDYEESLGTDVEAAYDDFYPISQAIEASHTGLLAAEKFRIAEAEAQRKRDAVVETERRRIEKQENEKALLLELIEKHGIPEEAM